MYVYIYMYIYIEREREMTRNRYVTEHIRFSGHMSHNGNVSIISDS